MVTITFIDASGSEHVVQAKVGNSLMEAAVQNGIRGLLAECGGACSCATCHLYIEPQWASAVGEPGGIEKDMLEMAVAPTACSRLACQIMVTNELDGLVARVPASQV
jgi:ferredoxin, 2Fe-2S